MLLAVAIAAAALAGGPSDARLTLIDKDPMTVRGAHFERRERVTVTLTGAGTDAVHRVRAGRRGRFTTTFRHTDGSEPCSVFLIRAMGAGGSEAILRSGLRPGCAPTGGGY